MVGDYLRWLAHVCCSWVCRLNQPSFAISAVPRSEEHTSELQSHVNLVCRLLLEKKNVPPTLPCVALLGRARERALRRSHRPAGSPPPPLHAAGRGRGLASDYRRRLARAASHGLA